MNNNGQAKKPQTINIPQQKTFTVSKTLTNNVSEACEELDRQVSQWLRERAETAMMPPMFGKFYADNENLYTTYFYINVEEKKEVELKLEEQ